MKFSGLQPFGHVFSLIDFTIDGIGDVDLRNDAHIVSIRFLPGKLYLSIIYDFVFDAPGDQRIISLEFREVEIIAIAPYLETGVDPGYGHALLFGVGYWSDTRLESEGREGFTVETTTLEVSFYAKELKVAVA